MNKVKYVIGGILCSFAYILYPFYWLSECLEHYLIGDYNENE